MDKPSTPMKAVVPARPSGPKDLGPRVAVIGIPGAWSSESLATAFGERTGFGRVVDLADVVLDLGSGTCRAGDLDLTEVDAVVLKKAARRYAPEVLDRLEMLRLLEHRGVPMFSKPSSVIPLINRLSCTVALARAGIPMPKTVITASLVEAEAAVRRFGAAVLKPHFSTKAEGMEIVEAAMDDLPDRLARFRENHPVLYIQKRLPTIDRDLGVVFLGGVHVGTYARVRGEGSWNTTIRAGGRYESFELAKGLVQLAHRAQALFDLDFTSVDMVLTEEGPLVFEVSAFGGFRGLRDGLGIDAAALYADHVLAALAR